MSQSSVHADAGRKVIVSGTDLSGLLSPDHTGPYNRIFDLIVDGFPAPVVLTVMPTRRARLLFERKESDCLFVGSDGTDYYLRHGLDLEKILISASFNQIRIKIYSARGAEPFQHKDDLAGKIVAVDAAIGNTSRVVDMLGASVQTILVVQTLEQGFHILDIGRVSGLVAIDTDVKYLQAQKAHYKDYAFSPNYNVQITDDVLTCHKMPHTIPFMDQVNQKIMTMKEKGIIEQLLIDPSAYD